MLDFNYFASGGEPNFDHYYRGPIKPFENLQIPSIVHEFIQAFLKSEAAYSKGRTLPPRKTEQVLMFGGFALDQKLGLPSKDYDLYICSPQLVKEMKDYIREYTFEEILSHGSAPFPLTLTLNEDGFQHVSENSLVGKYFSVAGLYIPSGPTGLDYDSAKTFDLCFGERQIELQSFASITSAPVLSVVASVYPQEGDFSYHKQFKTQAEQGVLCTPFVNARDLKEKAARKGLEILTPEDYLLRYSQGKPKTFDL